MYTVFARATLSSLLTHNWYNYKTTWEDGAIYTFRNGSGMKVIRAALTSVIHTHSHTHTDLIPDTKDALESRCHP